MIIDFVITWVDGNDPKWKEEKNKYTKTSNGDKRDKRYRDWELLRYWFRGIETNAPWVHRIFFVTYGHVPNWLNLNHPKLVIVKHEDYIPHQYLPTFSCRPIELNLHLIPGLSEHFVYFNDDMFLMKKTKETDFFKMSLPCDSAILQATYLHGEDTNGDTLKPENYNTSNLYNLVPINRHFDKRTSMATYFWKWFSPKYGIDNVRSLLLLPWGEFTGFKNTHLPYSYLKSTFVEAWENEFYLLNRACEHKFRDSTDISSRMMSFWQIAEGRFFPRSTEIGKYYSICNDSSINKKTFDTIKKNQFKMICINDEYSGNEFELVKDDLIKCFESVFPNKSSYEL